MEEWLKEWNDKIVPLRQRFGFRIVGAWKSEDGDRFVWILRWDGEGTFEDADQKYYNSPERKAIDPDPARHLLDVRHHMMQSLRD